MNHADLFLLAIPASCGFTALLFLVVYLFHDEEKAKAERERKAARARAEQAEAAERYRNYREGLMREIAQMQARLDMHPVDLFYDFMDFGVRHRRKNKKPRLSPYDGNRDVYRHGL